MNLIRINEPSGKWIYINPAQITLLQRTGARSEDLEIVLAARTLTMPGEGDNLDKFAGVVHRALNDIPEPQTDVVESWQPEAD